MDSGDEEAQAVFKYTGRGVVKRTKTKYRWVSRHKRRLFTPRIPGLALCVSNCDFRKRKKDTQRSGKAQLTDPANVPQSGGLPRGGFPFKYTPPPYSFVTRTMPSADKDPSTW